MVKFDKLDKQIRFCIDDLELALQANTIKRKTTLVVVCEDRIEKKVYPLIDDSYS